LLHRGDEKYLSEKTLLCGEGQPSDAMYVLLEGQIDVTRKDTSGQMRTLTTLHAPALLGHMGLIDGSNRSATCRAKTDVRVIQFTRARYHDLVEDRSRLGATLRRLLCSSLSGQLTGGNARIHALLAEIAPSEATDKIEAQDDITREDLREATGVLEGWNLETEGVEKVRVVQTEESKRVRANFPRRR
jgi:CRP-like cAMP-binding protein